jgi:DNA-binding MarR family transcriptional regulator
VSRQHVQKLVDELRRDGLVELSDNPRDRRAKLVSLTAKGRGLYAAMQARERALMEHLGAEIPERDVRTAVAVLRAVRARFDAEEWERLLR